MTKWFLARARACELPTRSVRAPPAPPRHGAMRPPCQEGRPPRRELSSSSSAQLHATAWFVCSSRCGVCFGRGLFPGDRDPEPDGAPDDQRGAVEACSGVAERNSKVARG